MVSRLWRIFANMNYSNDAIKQHYLQNLNHAQKQLNTANHAIFRISIQRLMLFVLALVGLYLLRRAGGLWLSFYILTIVTIFIWLVKRHAVLFREKQKQETAVRLYKAELKAMDMDASSFDDGSEWIDPSHDFTYDLDIFGPRSLFQYLNRTCTELGRKKLADWLQNPPLSQSDIADKQKCISTLADEPEFRETLRIEGMLCQELPETIAFLRHWAITSSAFHKQRLIRIWTQAVPVINAILIAGAIMEWIPWSLFGSIFFLFVFISLLFQKRITIIQSQYDQAADLLGTHKRLLKLIESRSTSSSNGKDISALWKRLLKTLKSDMLPASAAISLLHKELDILDRRGNILVSIILDGLYMWQLRQMLRIEAWRKKYGRCLNAWLDTIGEVDALCALATYAYNNPDTTYPVIIENDKDFKLEITGMKHPLMRHDICVPNDAQQPQSPYFVIITGANMAGKSTYLRTLGVNYLLACIGAPVLCEKMFFQPRSLITSLRTSDSLTDNESYFFAELKRLGNILKRLESGQKLFIILDEILKGTNSKDKQRGSVALMKRLLELGSNGVIATHDLVLGTLADRFPGKIENNRFEAEIRGNNLTFSYRMQPGIAQNMNACFLMRRMGLDIED